MKYAAPVKPVWLNFNTTTGVLSGTPNNDHVGAHDISLTVTDSSGLKATQAFTLTVTNVNDAPTLSVTNGSLTEDSGSYIASGTLIGKDVDADTTLSYSVNTTTGTYGNLTFNTANGNYTYTMDNAKSAVQALNGSQSLTESFTVSVSDGIAKTSKTLSFVINGANDAPTNLALSANSIAKNSTGASVGTLSAKDVDGDTLIYSLASGGDNNSFEISGTTLKLKSSISANYEANNVYDLTIIASDGVASTSLAKEVIVTNVNETSRSSTIYGKAGTNKSASLNEDRNPAIENLMSGLFWGSAGSGIDLTYSFMEPGSKFHPQYGSWVKEKDQVQAASNIFKSTVLDAFELYSSVSLLSFSEISESGNTVAEIRLGTSATSGRSGAFLPNGHTVSGDIWLLSENNYFNNSLALQDGYFWNTTIAHEIGHSLGLEHPFEAASYGNRTYGTDKNIGSVHNALPYSVMAYEEYIGLLHDTNAGNIFSLPTTLMIDDIAALQHLYGVNEQYNSSDTIYTLKSFKDVDRAGNHDRDADYIFASIWDAGGDDTFSWAGQSTVASIDLNAGSFSCFGNITGPDDDNLDDLYLKDGDGILGIAYNAVIENAIGGSNEDTIVGNSAANTLYGGAGAGVKDTLTGNGGADIFVCSLSDASTDLSVADIIFGFTNSSDKIGLEDRTFSDLTISNASGPYSGKTQIVDTNSSKVLFLLDGIDASLIDETDFVVTDFV